MNITVIIFEIFIMFLFFGFLAFGLPYINPLTFISDYPPEIQEEYYRTQNKQAIRKKTVIWILFANIKRIRLPGTEHMEKEYHPKWFHVKVCLPIIPVVSVAGVLSSLIMIWIW